MRTLYLPLNLINVCIKFYNIHIFQSDSKFLTLHCLFINKKAFIKQILKLTLLIFLDRLMKNMRIQ